MNNSSKRRAVVFVHFDKNDIVDKYVIYYLRCLNNVCNNLIFVTTSALPEDEVSKVSGICDQVVLRENIGYDFMSYKVGLQHIDSTDYDEVVICNDSVYGPLFPIDKLFTKMQAQQDCDFWGITECDQIAYHIQSYFLVFRKSVIESQCFKKFWKAVSVIEKKTDIIEKYEVGLSQLLINNGFQANTYITLPPSFLDYMSKRARRQSITKMFNIHSWKKLMKDIISSGKKQNLNPTHFFWKKLIRDKKMPFIKIELLRDNPMKIDIKDYEDVIKRHTDYDIKMIRTSLERSKKTRFKEKDQTS